MNARSLLSAMEFVHLKRRYSGRFVLREIERFARRRRLSPVSGTHIVVHVCTESARGRQETVCRTNISAFRAPAENERLIKGIRKSSTSTQRALDIGSERIVGDRQGSRKRKYRATQLPYLLSAHENKTIHIHDLV